MKKLFGAGCAIQLIFIGVGIWVLYMIGSFVITKINDAGSVPKAVGQSVNYIKTEFNEGVNDTIPNDTLVIKTNEIK